MSDTSSQERIDILLAEGLHEDVETWAKLAPDCSPEELLDLVLWWRDGGFTAGEAAEWSEILGPAGMLWAPRWVAAGYSVEQAAELLAAGIGIEEAARHWPAKDLHRYLAQIRLVAALQNTDRPLS